MSRAYERAVPIDERPKKIYVAASSSEVDRAREFMRLADLAGWEITLDWPAAIAEHGGVANPPDARVEEAATWARANLLGVEQADVFVMLAPLDGSPAQGAFAELGSAVARSKPSLVVRAPTCHSIFQALATVQAGSDAEGHALLARWARDGIR